MLTESQKGKVGQDLLDQTSVIGSQRRINVALSSVDNEAVYIIFYLRGGSQGVMFAQIKSTWLSSQGAKRGVFRTQVRRAILHPRENYFFIFAVCHQEWLQLGETLWIVPSQDFSKLTCGQDNPERILLHSRFNSNDMWQKYELSLRELPSRIVGLLGTK
jgi:hypothetical protein